MCINIKVSISSKLDLLNCFKLFLCWGKILTLITSLFIHINQVVSFINIPFLSQPCLRKSYICVAFMVFTIFLFFLYVNQLSERIFKRMKGTYITLKPRVFTIFYVNKVLIQILCEHLVNLQFQGRIQDPDRHLRWNF